MERQPSAPISRFQAAAALELRPASLVVERLEQFRQAQCMDLRSWERSLEHHPRQHQGLHQHTRNCHTGNRSLLEAQERQASQQSAAAAPWQWGREESQAALE